MEKMKKILPHTAYLGTALIFLLLTGCFSKTVKETATTPPVIVAPPAITAPANPAASQSTTSTPTSSDGTVERQSTTTYSNP
jgi:hypothetical protein